ncbi:hypothetical protein GIB67_009856 [Kingdonia uniflora]|uniref:Uncharacterized protein n=1 Tax=Kingdonia uniflora TaxID=39325 RepID=A0A7J7LMI0_9MAGN|nr:hypothetical protein GIB67_009856 [Kingdonia uniflora]
MDNLWSLQRDKLQSLKMDKQAPEDTRGNDVDLSTFRGKVLLIVSVASQCYICFAYKENTVLQTVLPPEKLFVIPNAVDTAMFKSAPERLNNHEIVVIVISIRKGADLLVGIILEICHLYPKVRFIVGGDGPKDFLTDALCIAILEAASCGLLTVSTRVGGVPEVLPDDMVAVAEPISSDMVKAIPKAIYILPKIDLEVIHFRMKKLYSWHDVTKRTEVVYDCAFRIEADNAGLYSKDLEFFFCGEITPNLFLDIFLRLWYMCIVNNLNEIIYHVRSGGQFKEVNWFNRGTLMDDAMILPCGHSFRSGGMQHVTMTDTSSHGHSLSMDISRGRGLQFPFIVTDRVIIKVRRRVDLPTSRFSKHKWYPISKTLAEKAVWDYAGKLGFDIVSFHPATCLGPLLQPSLNASCAVLQQLLQGSKDNLEYHWLGAVHVKDVANA